MPFNLELPDEIARQGWKVKIRDRERVEPPHVTIIRGLEAWRFGLRTMTFMDAQPDPRRVPTSLQTFVNEQMHVLRTEWDRMYPENPVGEIQ